MNIYSKHYWKIEKYKQNFERMLKLLKKSKGLELAVYAANYFVYHNTGYFSSSILERRS